MLFRSRAGFGGPGGQDGPGNFGDRSDGRGPGGQGDNRGPSAFARNAGRGFSGPAHGSLLLRGLFVIAMLALLVMGAVAFFRTGGWKTAPAEASAEAKPAAKKTAAKKPGSKSKS